MGKKISFFGISFGLFFSTILIGIAGWTLYNLINQAMTDFVGLFGINNFYVVAFIILIFCVICLMLLGYKGRKIIKKIVGT